MFELEAKGFVGAAVEIRTLQLIIDRVENKAAPIGPDDATTLVFPKVRDMINALEQIGAKSALASANRLAKDLTPGNPVPSYQDVRTKLADIESRFADHLDNIQLFVLREDEAQLMESAEKLVPVPGFTGAFPNASFEIEEAAKCLALGRYTASVFHVMRSLEYGIKALATFMAIPDPTRPAERNWGKILEAIKDKLDEEWPKSTRLPNSEGAKLEGLYAHLDAVRNPWRNTTMHVETVYAPHEAVHIVRCCAHFLVNLMQHCDETGAKIVPQSP